MDKTLGQSILQMGFDFVMNLVHLLAFVEKMHPIGMQCCDENYIILDCFKVAMSCVEPKALDVGTS